MHDAFYPPQTSPDGVLERAVRAAYASAAQRMPGVTLEAFRAELEACEVHPVLVDGEPVGAVVVKGPEIHACVLPKARGRWFSRQYARLLAATIAKHGRATTSATTEDGRRFVERLGFVPAAGHYVKEAS